VKYLIIFLIVIGFAFAQEQEIEIWTAFSGLELTWLESQTNTFTNLFSVSVDIKQLKIGEINQRLLLSFRDDSIELPDLIVGLAHNQIPKLSKNKTLANLQKYSTEDYLADLSKNARLAFSENGQLLGFPLFLEGPALIVNKDLLTKIPESFEDLLASAKKLSSEDVKGFEFDATNLYFAYPFLASHGGKLFNQGELSIETESFKKGVEFLRDLRFKYHLFEQSPSYQELTKDFYFGKLAFVYDGPWAIKEYQKQIDLQVIPIPPTQAGLELNSLASAYGIVLLKKSEDDLNAVNLAKWLSRPEAQVELAESAFKIPSSIKAIKQLDNDVLAGFARALTNAQLIPANPQMGNTWGPLSNALFKILVAENSNIDGILKQAVQDIKNRQ